MARQSLRDRKPNPKLQREFHCRAFLPKLCQVLNEPDKFSKRIVRLVKDCLELSTLAQAFPKGDWLWEGRNRKTKDPRVVQCYRLADRISRALRRDKAALTIEVSGTGSDFDVDWWPVSQKSSDEDFDIILTVTDALRNGFIQLVRKCACGKYFAAPTPTQRFCSAKCRIRFWENSEERKERKRKLAREYYYLHKYKNVK